MEWKEELTVEGEGYSSDFVVYASVDSEASVVSSGTG